MLGTSSDADSSKEPQKLQSKQLRHKPNPVRDISVWQVGSCCWTGLLIPETLFWDCNLARTSLGIIEGSDERAMGREIFRGFRRR